MFVFSTYFVLVALILRALHPVVTLLGRIHDELSHGLTIRAALLALGKYWRRAPDFILWLALIVVLLLRIPIFNHDISTRTLLIWTNWLLGAYFLYEAIPNTGDRRSTRGNLTIVEEAKRTEDERAVFMRDRRR